MNFVIKKCLFALLPVVVCAEAYCDTADAPYPWILTADKGHVFFAIYPSPAHSKNDDDAKGICYRLEPDGSVKELWRISGWYMFGGYLSRSGDYLVRLGPWAEDLTHHSDLAVAIYKNGKLVKEYRVNELIKDLDALEYSASHYSWLPGRQSEPNQFIDNQFKLTLIDKTIYFFDLDTGEIIDTNRDPYAVAQSIIDGEVEKQMLDDVTE
jgi:hypothetical protein